MLVFIILDSGFLLQLDMSKDAIKMQYKYLHVFSLLGSLEVNPLCLAVVAHFWGVGFYTVALMD